ncbi:unnamed protein product [Effrenium voratum]|nr:unnamed protein product [Effrenium voratum]
MSRGTVRDARVEELFGIRVGMTLANFYEDDTMWHERLVLWPSMEDRHLWYILTPDFDVYPELFNLDGNTGPNRVRMKGTTFSYWSRFSEPTYRFSDAVDDDAFKKYVQKAIEEVKKAGHWDDSKIPQMMLNLKGEEVATTSYLGRMLVNRRLKGKGAVIDPSNQGLAPVKPVCMAPEGFVWISEENCGGRSLGEELPVFPGAGVMVSEKLALVKVGQDWVKGRLVKVEDVPDYVESLRKRYEVPTPVLAELSKALGPETAALEVEGAEAGKSPDDARILAVDYDAQDERYKEWKVVCQECAEYPFKDWPLEGPVCTHHMLKQMQRAGGTPRSWLQTWARFKQIPENDRIMFEMRTLVEAVEYGGTYDQLNLASLASFECISRRIMAIVDAFGAGGAGNPDWGAAKIFTGYRGPEDIVMPQLKQWASKKGKEEAELHQARTKMRELRRGVVTEEAAAAVAGGALPSAAAARRPGKKGVRQEGRLSRRSQQRFCRKARMQDDIRETVKALNWMNGFSPSLEFEGQPDDMQTQVLGRAVHLTKLAWGPGTLPTVPPEEAALRELLKGRSEYEDSSLPVTLARFEIERISLPETLEGVPDVAALLPAEARQYLESPELMVRDEARAGLFFVHKSDKKKIRLIVDARPANRIFRSPPSVRLCTAEGFSRIEVEIPANLTPGSEAYEEYFRERGLHFGLADVKDCFHRMLSGEF